jgi:hypothetical protein
MSATAGAALFELTRACGAAVRGATITPTEEFDAPDGHVVMLRVARSGHVVAGEDVATPTTCPALANVSPALNTPGALSAATAAPNGAVLGTAQSMMPNTSRAGDASAAGESGVSPQPVGTATPPASGAASNPTSAPATPSAAPGGPASETAPRPPGATALPVQPSPAQPAATKPSSDHVTVSVKKPSRRDALIALLGAGVALVLKR